MYNKMKELLINNKFAAMYSDSNYTSKFLFGKIIALDETWLLVEMFTPEGNYDGLLLKGTDSFFKVEIDSKYNKKIEVLISLKEIKRNDYNFDNNNLPHDLLEFAKSTNEVVSIEILDSGNFDCIGIVDYVKDGTCKIIQLDEYGDFDGIIYFKVDDITQISYGSSDETIVRLLYENKKPHCKP